MKQTKEVTELVQQNDTLNTTDNKNYLVETRELENTPFVIVKQNEEYFGAIGLNRITEIYKSEDELIKELTTFSWNRVIQVVMLVNKELNKKENE